MNHSFTVIRDTGSHPNLEKFRRSAVRGADELPTPIDSAFNMEIDPRMKRHGARFGTSQQDARETD